MERFHLHELAFMVAARVLTADNPALALAKFGDDLADEIAAGRANLEGSDALRAAFRDAMGYSRRVPDETPGEDTMVAHGQLRVINGGDA